MLISILDKVHQWQSEAFVDICISKCSFILTSKQEKRQMLIMIAKIFDVKLRMWDWGGSTTHLRHRQFLPDGSYLVIDEWYKTFVIRAYAKQADFDEVAPGAPGKNTLSFMKL